MEKKRIIITILIILTMPIWAIPVGFWTLGSYVYDYYFA